MVCTTCAIADCNNLFATDANHRIERGPDGKGPPRPVEVEGSARVMEADIVLLALGE